MTGPANWKPRFLMAFEIVSDRGVLAGVVLPSPTTTRSLITGLPSGRHHDKTGAWERDGHCLTRFPADRISQIGDYAGDRRSVPRRIERFFRGRWAPPAVADYGNALGPTQQPRKAVERHRRWPEILFQEPNRMVGGEIGKASGRAQE